MVIKVNGYIEFEPENKTRKHNSQASWKRVAMIHTHDDLAAYYAWFIKTRFNLELNKPLRGSHVTIINDRDIEVPLFDKCKEIFHNKKITFYIDPLPRTNAKHWWLRVYAPDAEAIRIACGGSPIPNFDFHLTLGYANEKNLAHSEYILECCKSFEIIPNGARKPLDEHQIFEF